MLKLLGVKTLTKPDKVTARQLIELNFHHLYKNKMLLLKALLVNLVSKWDLQETLHNQMTKSWQNQRIFYRTDIVYKMPGKVDELTIWDDEGKHNLHKYYLTMYLKEAQTLYLESGENEGDKWSLSAFCNLHWKNVLLLGDSLKEQCKCQVHENFFLKLEATGCSYGSSWLENVLWDIYPNNPCWNNRCKDCKDGKRLIPKKVSIHWHVMNSGNTLNHPVTWKTKVMIPTKKIAIVMTERFEKFLVSFRNCSQRWRNIRVSNEFKQLSSRMIWKSNHESVWVLQIDYAIAYQCELQKETMGALRARGNVNLFICASLLQRQCCSVQIIKNLPMSCLKVLPSSMFHQKK